LLRHGSKLRRGHEGLMQLLTMGELLRGEWLARMFMTCL
jgi:hypothetical protein